ncbi:probable G-protein coupled receptor Mth-like 10 [Nylanderia fulva]|uniref:probable G-protein coupled receptor Mth-like 10 n=1 Tax=Nylanderia fulva TaxID=613905 RepID=UPI0010FB0107|nr:probable G-protein coupled receptor Mth-like 10 [Nylanderia fulva]XP_029176128.1 probable G-protein coupled receptor Mth-like 10 [Nylanderia fulva]
MEYEFSTISTNIDRDNVDLILHNLKRRSAQNHEDDDKILTSSHINSTNVNHKKNSTSQKVYENLLEKNYSMSNKVFENSTKHGNESNIVPYETCYNTTCILFCCPFGYSMRANDSQCIPEKMKYVFPNVYEYTNDLMQNESKRVDEFFQLAVYDPCLKARRSTVHDGHQYEYKIFANGSIYLPYYKILFKSTYSTSYCLAVLLERESRFEVTYCSEISDEVFRNALKQKLPEFSWITQLINIYSSLILVGVLFLLAIFLVYYILPELQNEHGFMLRNYTAVAAIGFMIEVVRLSHIKENLSYPACITIAFLDIFVLCRVTSGSVP